MPAISHNDTIVDLSYERERELEKKGEDSKRDGNQNKKKNGFISDLTFSIYFFGLTQLKRPHVMIPRQRRTDFFLRKALKTRVGSFLPHHPKK